MFRTRGKYFLRVRKMYFGIGHQMIEHFTAAPTKKGARELATSAAGTWSPEKMAERMATKATRTAYAVQTVVMFLVGIYAAYLFWKTSATQMSGFGRVAATILAFLTGPTYLLIYVFTFAFNTYGTTGMTGMTSMNY